MTAARILRTPAALADAGLLADGRALDAVARRYAVAVSPSLAALIDRDDPADPIALQFVPSPRELDRRPAEIVDPIGDAARSPVKGIVHRYPDRVLLKIVSVCPVYCRFCFRRETVGPGADGALSRAEIDAALAYVAARPDIWELIVTGGDPLALSAARIAELTQALAAIPHLRIVRFHTRAPIATPERVTPALARALGASGKAVVVALHANHPRELTPAARDACARLAGAGATLVSQSVLLRGVNDDAAALAALMRGFVEASVKPYYLHHPDLAPGTGHFRLPIARGLALVRALRGRLSGLCQPTYVLDLPGGFGKVALDSGAARTVSPGVWDIDDFTGRTHRYVEDVPDEPPGA